MIYKDLVVDKKLVAENILNRYNRAYVTVICVCVCEGEIEKRL